MLTLPLEPTDDRANPVFKDAASCKAWLGQLQLTNLQLAHSKLLAQIKELNRYPMRGVERFNTLELLRETVGFVQEDFAKKLIGKPLPLNESELTVLLSIVQLWQAMVEGYQRGLQAYISGEKQLSKHGALLCQRCLLYSGLEIFEHLRTGYEFSPRLWRQLHELYAYAEQQQLHQIEVSDPPGGHSTSCTGSYVKTLLGCYANPAQMTRWQLQQMNHWLSTLSDSVTVACNYSISKNDAAPLAADLSGTQGLQRVEELPHNEWVRYLAMVPLSKQLRIKIILLQQGKTPQQVGLGDQLDSHACLELIILLHQCWCEDKHKRLNSRRSASMMAALSYRPDGIYAHLSGKSLKQDNLNSLALKQIETLGHPLSVEQKQMGTGYPLENWLMENENIMGVRLTRTDTTGGRLRPRQLIALRPGNAQSFMLGTTAWANVTQKGRLQIGVKYLPGQPLPVRVSTSGINPAKVETPAFLLPALPSLKTPASLIIPRDWFKPARVIEVRHPDGKILAVRLGFSVERGLDYERVSFTILNPES
jgi:hypothetical protein